MVICPKIIYSNNRIIEVSRVTWINIDPWIIVIEDYSNPVMEYYNAVIV